LPTENSATTAFTFPASIDFTGCVAAPTTMRYLPLAVGPVGPANVPALAGLLTDIWGTGIRYRRVVTTPFGASDACVTPFVLVSYGPDRITGGATGSLDDIIYPVTKADITTAITPLGGW
jgi:hypothetical protein